MKQDKTLLAIYDALTVRSLNDAIQRMEYYLTVNPHQINSDRLFAIKTDYQVMKDYWRKGYKDPQLAQQYDKLLRRMYVLYANVSTNARVLHSPFLASLFMKVRLSARDWSVQVMKEQLESFVSDVAMLDLEPPHTSQERRKELYRQHHQLMSEIFAYILTSDVWTEGQGEAMEQLLLSPTVDSIDQQIIVSAMTLAAMNCFDLMKLRTMLNVYQQSSDEYVRQRALVGWVFCIDDDLHMNLFTEMKTWVEKALENPNCSRELAELQQQIYFCMHAEEDRDTIQKEIMPDLIKNQQNIGRDGVFEQDEESVLNDILHPDNEEQSLEAMENSFRRMVDMQKQGVDIYFGGFSQMKRFPFFNEIVNWFTPYYLDHPGIITAREKFGNIKFLQGMMEYGPFCNSDKYSFMLAFETVLHQIPASVLEMLNRGEAQMVQKMSKEEMFTPVYIRRIYLQDLFRFFRLFSQRTEFYNIFSYDGPECLFFDYCIFQGTKLQEQYADVISFLIKRKRQFDAQLVLDSYRDEQYYNYDYYMLSAYLGKNDELSYRRALDLNPQSERAMWGLAKVLFKENRCEAALDLYNQLVELNPDKKSYQLNKAVCLTNLHRYEEAEQILFRWNYENADDLNVARVLAWTLTCDGKYEQAGRLYEQLMAEETPADGDLLNYGFYLWFTGKIDEAANCFRTYKKHNSKHQDHEHNVQLLIRNEQYLLDKNGIIEEEITLMYDLIDA